MSKEIVYLSLDTLDIVYLELDACQYDVGADGTATQVRRSRCQNNGYCYNGTQENALGQFACDCALGPLCATSKYVLNLYLLYNVLFLNVHISSPC